MTWNIANIVVCLVIAAIVVAIVASIVRNKRKGYRYCDGCKGCGASDSCPSAKHIHKQG